MNDLLIKTAEFFFVPEAVLSTVFLVCFVGIFYFGVHRQSKCREFLRTFDAAAEESFKALSAKMTPEMFIKKKIRNLSVAEALLEELPNVFVSVGIVATFLGLGVAIQGAAELLQTDKLELSKLTAVLGVIAFKFQTSVWGICFSIVFRNVVVERYFEFRRQIIDEITDRLYTLERDNARTLIERQNELIAAQHKELLAANAAHQRDLLEALTVFKSVVHEDNLAGNEHLRYLADNFKEFVAVAKDFAKDELAFAESVEAFTQRVRIFQEEFATLVHREMSELKAINEGLGRMQAEHIQKIHDEHAANIFYTTQELDKLHQKFYLDAGRFAEESRRTFDDLLNATVGRVHDEYTHEAHEIRSAINELNSMLAKIENNSADSFERANALMQNTAGNFKTAAARLTALHEEFYKISKTFMDEQTTANNLHLEKISAQSEAVVDVVKALQENIPKLVFNNQTAAEKLSGELVAVKGALENLTAVVNAEDERLQKVSERLPSSTKKLLPVVSAVKSKSSTFDGRDEK